MAPRPGDCSRSPRRETPIAALRLLYPPFARAKPVALRDSSCVEMTRSIRPHAREGSTSVPALTAALPITRQAIAKHLAALGDAGLVEREPGGGREVRYRLRAGALRPANAWLDETAAAWDDRLARLKRSVEAPCR